VGASNGCRAGPTGRHKEEKGSARGEADATVPRVRAPGRTDARRKRTGPRKSEVTWAKLVQGAQLLFFFPFSFLSLFHSLDFQI
jgi:hypothetical protein